MVRHARAKPRDCEAFADAFAVTGECADYSRHMMPACTPMSVGSLLPLARWQPDREKFIAVLPRTRVRSSLTLRHADAREFVHGGSTAPVCHLAEIGNAS